MLEDVHPSARAMLEQAGAQVTSAPGSMPADELKNALSGVHLLGIRSRTNLDAGLLESASELIAIGCFCIGTNQVDLDRACGLGIPVFNAPFANSRSVAELTMCEIVALLRGLLRPLFRPPGWTLGAAPRIVPRRARPRVHLCDPRVDCERLS